jgi:TonB family protein
MIRRKHLAPLSSLAALLAVLLSAATVRAQFGSPPVPVSFADPVYPPIARAAHVSGEVVVHFSIEDDGSTSQVQLVSGPPMLEGTARDAVKRWRFHIPLPIGAQRDFEARFHFKFADHATAAEQPDDLDEPPDIPTGGDDVEVPAAATAITSEVRSLGGSQTIQPPPQPAPPPACPANPQVNTPPVGQTLRDFIELSRGHPDESDAPGYSVRIFRDGSVEWQGRFNVAVVGSGGSSIAPAAAQKLFDLLNAAGFWEMCPAQPEQPDWPGDAIIAQVGAVKKTVYTNGWSSMGVNPKYAVERLMWAIDKAADTHQWRHGDPFLEPFTNMREDITQPKPGVTLLIRAVLRSWLSDPDDAVDKLVAPGIDVNEGDSSGWTPLMYAVQLDPGGTPELALLKAHADVNRRSARGDTALLIAAWRGALDHDLLAVGADINLVNNAGITALMLLVERGDPAVLKAALAAGADARMKDREGRTALDYLNAAACGKPLVPLEPGPARYDSDGNVLPPPPLPPCPSTNPIVLEDEATLRAAMRAATAR